MSPKPAPHPGAQRVLDWMGAGRPVPGFIALAQDPEVHAWLVSTGWSSDGSSRSTDLVMGVRIGASGVEYANRAADDHDRAYELSRRLGGLPGEYRKAADRLYRDKLAEALRASLEGPFLQLGLARARIRYAALRLFATGSWHP